MRNSIPTAGFSEIMHDAKTDPAEASFTYAALARTSPDRGLSTTLRPALFGTVKSARSFVVEVRSAEDGTGFPSPMDLALTGIGSCALTTLLIGGTARETVFDSAEMVIEHGVMAENGELGVSCGLEIDGATDREKLDDLTEQMRCFSPNFATMTGAVPVALECVFGSTPRQLASGESAARVARSVSCAVRWISGMQLESYPSGAQTLRVDQPKQVGGVDWGPNPQEYLLMGLAADVANGLGQLTLERTGERQIWEVTASAREDIRGLLLKQYDVVTLRDVVCSIGVPERFQDAAEAENIVGAAFAQSEVRDLIVRPRAAEINLHLGI